MNTSLQILYTANLRGNINLLPRLQTFLRQLKSLPLDEGEDVMICAVQPVTRPTLLLDLGNCCAPEVWHCAATGGRSMLIGLDAMGYRAANVSGTLTEEAQTRLRDSILGMTLVDEQTPFTENNILITAQDTASSACDIHIVLTPADRTRLDGKKLFLASLEAGQIGIVHVGRLDTTPVIESQGILDISPTTPPDPTLSGTVDFILSEARAFQRKNATRK